MKKTLLVLTVVAALTACTRQNDYVATPVAAPMVVEQPSNNGTVTGALLGGVAGYMLGKNSAKQNAVPSYSTQQPVIHNTTVINKTVVVKNYAKPITPSVNAAPSRLSLAKSSSFSRRK